MVRQLHLVTGGAGYFGETLVHKLLASDKRVRVFDLNRLKGLSAEMEVESIQGDIRDLDAVRSACDGVSHVHHNVAQVPLAKDKELFWTVNRDGTRNILQASLEAGVSKLVYTSTSAVFGVPKSNPVNESTPPSPFEEYGKAKLEGEHLCHEFVAKGLDVSIVRPRTIVGHGRLGIFQILFEWVLQGRNIPVLGAGDNIYQFVHASDLAEACIQAVLHPGSEIFNIGAAEFCSMRQTLEGLCHHAGTGSQVKSLPMAPMEWAISLTGYLGISPLGPYHALMYGRSLYFDTSKARLELGLHTRYSNITALCDSFDWYVSHRDEVLQREHESAHRSALKQGALAALKFII